MDVLHELNRRHLERQSHHSELEARLESYELTFRMQTAAPEAFDLSQETQETKQFYGLDHSASKEYGGYTVWLAGGGEVIHEAFG